MLPYGAPCLLLQSALHHCCGGELVMTPPYRDLYQHLGPQSHHCHQRQPLRPPRLAAPWEVSRCPCARLGNMEPHHASGLSPERPTITIGTRSSVSVFSDVLSLDLGAGPADGWYPHASAPLPLRDTLDRASHRLYLLTCAQTSLLCVLREPSLL